MRAFVAIDVSEPGGHAGTTGTPAHLTLQFLGEVEVARVPAISAAVGPAVADVAAYDLTIEGVGAFPSVSRPRVVWLGVTEGAGPTRELAQRVDAALRPLGLGSEKGPFVPHLTVLRVRSPRDRERAARLLAGEGLPPPRRVRVTEVLLKESELGPGGARHRTVAAFPLAARPGG